MCFISVFWSHIEPQGAMWSTRPSMMCQSRHVSSHSCRHLGTAEVFSLTRPARSRAASPSQRRCPCKDCEEKRRDKLWGFAGPKKFFSRCGRFQIISVHSASHSNCTYEVLSWLPNAFFLTLQFSLPASLALPF